MTCPNGHERKLVKSKKHKHADGTRAKNWVCVLYPRCDYRVRSHPDGRPVGVPADRETRELRKEVHDLCYQRWDYSNARERSHMYNWLKSNSKAGHIGQMDKEELFHIRDSLLRLLRRKML